MIWIRSAIVIAGCASLVAAAQVAPSTRNAAAAEAKKEAATASPEAVNTGEKIFQANCSFCHGANAKGGESGPDLLRSVVVLDDEQGNKIGPIVHGSRVDKGMPKFNLTDEQVADISAFLHEKIRAAEERGNYKILNIVTGNPQKGEQYFRAHCTSCHSVDGDLAHIAARMDPVEIQQHIVMPREFGRRRGAQQHAPDKGQAITATVTLRDGKSYQGMLAGISDFDVTIVTPGGDFRTFARHGDEPKVEIHDPLQAHTDMLLKYSDADIHDLTAYLNTLK